LTPTTSKIVCVVIILIYGSTRTQRMIWQADAIATITTRMGGRATLGTAPAGRDVPTCIFPAIPSIRRRRRSWSRGRSSPRHPRIRRSSHHSNARTGQPHL
jgi:hypothetical protein